MRKMYFAMIPKRSILEDALIVTAVVAGSIFGAKKLLGDQKFSEYKNKVLKTVGLDSEKEFKSVPADAASEVEDFTEDARKAKEEDDIVVKIRKAAKKAAEKAAEKL